MKMTRIWVCMKDATMTNITILRGKEMLTWRAKSISIAKKRKRNNSTLKIKVRD